MNTIDQDFERFACKGDLRALGRVYDASAAELLSVAARLVGDPVEAEDLVQATFVAAIESAETHESGRRVMPWLVGILNHRVRRWRRDRGPREVPPPSSPSSGSVDPVRALEAQEIEETVGQALDRVAEPYRAVLVLSLRHSMEPAEIAYALQRPPATVRSQLSRGKQMLRDALPAALVLPAALALLPTRGLAAVREVVMTKAAATTVAAAATTGVTAAGLKGWFLMASTTTKTLFAAGVVAGLSLMALRSATPTEEDAALAPATLEDRGAAPSTSVVVASPDGNTLEFRDPAPAAARRIEATPAINPVGDLEVRVHYEGQPLENVQICLESSASGALAFRRVLGTGSSGAARFEALPQGGYYVFSSAVQRREEVRIVGGERETLTIEAPQPSWVTGVVVGDPGGPIAEADLWMCSTPCSRGPIQGLNKADAQGRFRVPIWGYKTIGARAPGYQQGHRAFIAKPGETQHVELHLLAGGARIHGTVVDGASGAPVAGVIVRLGLGHSYRNGHKLSDGSVVSMVPREVLSDKDGAFDVEGLAPGFLRVMVDAPGYALSRHEVRLAVGGELELPVTLDQGRTVRGVVTQANGEPADGVNVAFRQDHQLGGRSCTTGEDGRYELSRLPAVALKLRAESYAFGRAETVLDLGPGSEDAQEWSPRLNPGWQGIAGVLQDASGNPLADWWIIAQEDKRLRGQGAPLRTGTDGRFAFRKFVSTPDVRNLVVYPPAESEGAYPDAFPVHVQRRVPIGSQDIAVVVPHSAMPSATIRGRLEAPAAGQPRGNFRLRSAAGAFRIIRFDKELRFECGPLAPGRWEIVPISSGQVPACGSWELHAGQALDIGLLSRPAEGLVVVKLDLSKARPAGQGPGSKDPQPSIIQLLHTESGAAEYLRHLTGGERRVSVPPGQYIVSIVGGPYEPLRRSVEVAAGASVEVALAPRVAARRTLFFEPAPRMTRLGTLDLVITREGRDDVVLSRQVGEYRGGYTIEVNLRPGRYRVVATGESGGHAERELEIESVDAVFARPVTIPLGPPR